MRRTLVGIAFGLLAASVAAPAFGFRDGRPVARFDPWVKERIGGVLATAPLEIDRLVAGDPLRTGWSAFESDTAGDWRVFVDERTGLPTLVSGTGLPWFEADEPVTLERLEARARAFLDRHADLMGRWDDVLVLDRSVSGEIRPDDWLLLFRQEVDGVEVEEARLEFHVNEGRLVMFGAHAWAGVQTTAEPRLDAADARAIVDAYLGVDTAGLEAASDPALAILPLDAAVTVDGVAPALSGAGAVLDGRPRVWSGPRGEGLTHALVWRFEFRVPGEVALWTAEVDARSGRLVSFFDAAHYASIRGGVFPVSPDGDCADGGCEIDGFPMPFADYTETGQLEAFSDAFGNVACSDPDASFETNLVGTYVETFDNCGPTSETGACAAGVDLGLKAGENCDAALGASPGNTAAARSGYYQVNRVAEVARHYLPDNTWLDGRVRLNVNVDANCNATWSGQINMYRAGNGCGNTAEIQGVVTHEWGHGFDQNDGGGYDNTSEAYADVVAMFAARDSCIGRGFFLSGTCSGYGDTCLTCSGIRDHDWAARERNTPATPQDFVQNDCPTGSGPCGYSVHCEGYPIAGSIFDFATRDLPASGMDPATAWQTAERLWFGSRAGSGGPIYTCALPDTDSCAAGSWFQQMRAADDDDGNLANGTPHAAELYAAFARHNIACGLATDPENQSTSSCPTLAAPELSVTIEENGTRLTWGAVENADAYLVLRGELGCDRQQVPVATVAGTETTWVDTVSDPGLPKRYRVQAIGQNDVCRSSVSNCAIAPDGPRLQRNASRIVEDAVNSNANGFSDPGETFRLPTTLFNSGTADAFGVEGRLRVIDPAKGRVIGPDATWGDIPVNGTLESNEPHFEVTLFDAAQCGDAVALELVPRALDASPRAIRFSLPLGTPDRDYVQDAPLEIPNLGVVESTLEIADPGTLTELDVSVDINIFRASDLIVDLVSPTGTTVRLHDRTDGFGGLDTRYDLERDPDGPGTMDDYVGETMTGTWTLRIEDIGGSSIGSGTLAGWTLHTSIQETFDCEPYACPEPAPTESPSGLTVDKAPATSGNGFDLVFDWSPVTSVAGYHVLQSDDPTYATAVELTGRTDGATTLTVEDGAARTPSVSYFKVRSVNGCNEESP